MFKIGDRVRTLAVESRTDYANKVYANKIGTIVDISHPIGIAVCYRIKYDKPFYDQGYLVESHYYYDFQNGLELIE